MTPSLRNSHRYIWILLGISLPIAWWAAVNAIEDQPIGHLIHLTEPKALDLLAKSHQTDVFLFNIRTDSTGQQQQLEILIKKPLPNANITVTVCKNAESKHVMLGLLSSRGVRRFNLDTSMQLGNNPLLILEDKIKNVVIKTMTL